jgi:hypothetical protein
MACWDEAAFREMTDQLKLAAGVVYVTHQAKVR